MTVITTIDDLKQIYKRRAPRMFYDYCESGSWTEQTFRENSSDFDLLRLRQRVAVDVSHRSTRGQMIGQDVTIPLALAPVGMCGMQSAEGEIKAARAAEKFGVPFTLSTMSICSIEDVAAETNVPFWFQLYVMKDEDFVDDIIKRAKNAGVSALVITLDLQMQAQRHKDLKNGLSAPPRPTLGNIINLATKGRWVLGMLGTRRHTFSNVIGHASSVRDMSSMQSWVNEQFEPKLDWSMVARLVEKWGGKVILKGILDVEDAKRAVAIGANAIVVSNHGGRQLDGAISSIRALPGIVAAVGDQTEIWLDSGIRSGQDVLKSLALGAKGTMIGRAYIYGLGAMGEAGVTLALQVIQKELDMTMALCGRRDIATLNRDVLLIPKDFAGDWA